jgi:hypothetical protein
MDAQLFERVAMFLACETSYPLESINPGTRLREDIGLDGDDAMTVIETFQKVFNVNMEGFHFCRYFHDESLCGLNPLAWLVLDVADDVAKSPITVGDLIQAAAGHRWLAPPRS